MSDRNEELHKALEYLSQVDSDLAQIICAEGECRLKVKDNKEPYFALLEAIAGQQLHAKAATAILNRLKALNDGDLPIASKLLTFDDNELRSCGFSFQKIATIQNLAKAEIEGYIPSFDQAQKMTDQELIDLLTKLSGIGSWTVEMLLIFVLGRLDVMPVHDFGIREGWKVCKNLSVQPKPKDLKEMTVSWSPYRSVGAWYLWRAAERKKAKEKQNPLTL